MEACQLRTNNDLAERWCPDFSAAPQAKGQAAAGTPAHMEPAGPAPALLELAAPERSVRLRFGGVTARHVFRPVRLEDWLAYLKDARSELLIDGETSTAESREAEAALALWMRMIVRIEGYRAGADWKSKVPPAHRLAAVDLLQEVLILPAPDDPLDLESETRVVRLEANWNEAVYSDLLHRFVPPAEEHQLRYSRLMAEFYRKRGRDRRARITSPPKLRQLCALYDELIAGVEGYSVSHAAASDRQSAVEWMDPLHKQAAVLALFAGPERESEDAR